MTPSPSWRMHGIPNKHPFVWYTRSPHRPRGTHRSCAPIGRRFMRPAPSTATQRAKRLHLLDAAEVAALYERPAFTDEERAYYFSLTPHRNHPHTDLYRRRGPSHVHAPARLL